MFRGEAQLESCGLELCAVRISSSWSCRKPGRCHLLQPLSQHAVLSHPVSFHFSQCGSHRRLVCVSSQYGSYWTQDTLRVSLEVQQNTCQLPMRIRQEAGAFPSVRHHVPIRPESGPEFWERRQPSQFRDGAKILEGAGFKTAAASQHAPTLTGRKRCTQWTKLICCVPRHA